MIKKGRKESICNVIGRMITVTLFVMVLSLMPQNDIYAAVTESTIGDYSYSLDDSTLTASVIGYVGAGGNISIPATVTDDVNTYSVTSIGNYAFNGCSSLTGVTIPGSVTSVGIYAFNGCNSLTSVTLPNSVTSIGDYAFIRCSSLTSVTLPNSVTSIGEAVFRECSSLTNVTLPNGVTSIGKFAFLGCSGMTSVTLPNSVTSIGISAFAGCSSLTSVTLPDSVTSIEDSAFFRCSSLTSVTIPNSVTSIGASAFSSCTGLETVYYPAGLDVSGSNVLSYEASIITYTSNADDTITLLVENIQNGTTVLLLPVTINGKTVSDIQCAEGVDKLTTTPDTPEQTKDVTCSNAKVCDVVLSEDWTWQDTDKDIALTVDTPVTATAVYSGLDKAIYSNTEVEITITTEHSGSTALKNVKTASCKEAGYTGDTHCATCDVLLSFGSAIAKSTMHTGEETIKDAKAATCGENGYTGDICCETCNTKISDGSVVPKMDNHTYDNGVVTKAATVIETGVITYTCTLCKTIRAEDIDKLPTPPKDEAVKEPEEGTEETFKPEEGTEEILQPKEETEELLQPEEETEGVGELKEEEGPPAIKADAVGKRKGFSIFFVVIPVTVFVLIGCGVFVFSRKKK